MAAVRDLRELFVHELGDMLSAERRLVDTLPRLLRQTTDAELRDGFERHLEQTRAHVQNLERAFEALGEQPPAGHSHGLEGLETDYDERVAELSEELYDIFNARAAAHAEHYEISVYEGLIPIGEALEASEVVALLWQNLKEEKETLQELNTVTEKLATVRGPGSAMA